MRFYKPHGTSLEPLASGRPVVGGEYFELSKTEIAHPHNARLIEEGSILAASDAARKAVDLTVKEAKELAAQKAADDAAAQVALDAAQQAASDAAVAAAGKGGD